MMDRESRQIWEMVSQSPFSMHSLGNNLDPIPTQVIPDLNQADRFPLVGSTAPVAISKHHGIGAFMLLTKEGPPTFPAGNILQRSQPASCANPISETDSHPGT